MTANYIATGPSLAQIAAGDKIIYNGLITTVASVGTITLSQSNTSVSITLTAGSQVVTVTNATTILSSYSINSDGTRIGSWVCLS